MIGLHVPCAVTEITKKDLQGTALIILGVVLIVILGSINSGLSTSITVGVYPLDLSAI